MIVKKRADELEKLLAPCVNALGYDLWGVDFNMFRGRGKLCVYIDSATGISADDCETVSNQVGLLLDSAGNMPDRYTLEVSSPGLDRILFKPEQFEQSKGEEVELRLYIPVNGLGKINGILVGVMDDKILIDTESGQMKVEFAKVRRARIVPRF